MIKNGDAVHEVLAFIKELKQPCTIGVEILNDILTYEKIDAGEMPMERLPVDPLLFLETTLSPFRISARQKFIDLQLNLRLSRSEYSILIDDTKVVPCC